MRYTLALLSLAASAIAIPAGVPVGIKPSAGPPPGCSTSYPGQFEITTVNVTSSAKRDLAERQLSGTLQLTLADSILHDMAGRVGYIAANFQFQFDNPVQAGAIYTGGFSVCSNNTLALGGSAIFYSCLSGNFYNLYDRHWAAQCFPIYIEVSGASGTTPTSSGVITSSIVSVKSEGQPVPTGIVTSVSEKSEGQPVATTVVSEKSEGQPVATISQISDGQIQATTGVAVSEKPEGQPVATSAPAVSEKPEGQPIATSAAVSEKPEGQPIATSAASAVSEKPEGQPIATSAAVSEKPEGQPIATSAAVSEKPEGQPIATSAASAVSEKSEGQPIVTSAVSEKSEGQPIVTSAAVSEKSEGQPIATTSLAVNAATGTASASPSAFTGAAARDGQNYMAMAAGVIGAVAML